MAKTAVKMQESKIALTDKQRRFCEEYLVDLNATQAAIRAGYSRKTANQQGPRLLVNVGIQAEIQQKKAKRTARAESDGDQVIRELERIAFSQITDYLSWGPGGVELKDLGEIDPDKLSAIARVQKNTHGKSKQVAVKLHNKIGALTLLAKHFGLFSDKVEHSGAAPFQLILGKKA